MVLQLGIVLFLTGSALCGAQPEHDRADRLPRAAGARRRRPDGDRDGGGRRHHPAARSRPLPGHFRRRVRRRHGDRAAAWRLLRRSPVMALDLLRQPADRARRPRRDRPRLPYPLRAARAGDRLSRRRPAHPRALGDHPVHEPRRHQLRLALAADLGLLAARHRPDSRLFPWPNTVRASRSCRSASFATGCSGHERDRLHRRARALRRDHLPALLPPGGEGAEPVGLGAAAHADGGRRARHHDRQRILISGLGRYKPFPIVGTRSPPSASPCCRSSPRTAACRSFRPIWWCWGWGSAW